MFRRKKNKAFQLNGTEQNTQVKGEFFLYQWLAKMEETCSTTSSKIERKKILNSDQFVVAEAESGRGGNLLKYITPACIMMTTAVLSCMSAHPCQNKIWKIRPIYYGDWELEK